MGQKGQEVPLEDVNDLRSPEICTLFNQLITTIQREADNLRYVLFGAWIKRNRQIQLTHNLTHTRQ